MKTWIYILFLIINCFISAFSQILLKKSSIINYTSFIKQFINPYVILGYFLLFFVLFVNIYLLKFIPLSIANPISETIPIVLSLISGHILFNEKLSKTKIIGAILLILGIIILLF